MSVNEQIRTDAILDTSTWISESKKLIESNNAMSASVQRMTKDAESIQKMSDQFKWMTQEAKQAASEMRKIDRLKKQQADQTAKADTKAFNSETEKMLRDSEKFRKLAAKEQANAAKMAAKVASDAEKMATMEAVKQLHLREAEHKASLHRIQGFYRGFVHTVSGIGRGISGMASNTKGSLDHFAMLVSMSQGNLSNMGTVFTGLSQGLVGIAGNSIKSTAGIIGLATKLPFLGTAAQTVIDPLMGVLNVVSAIGGNIIQTAINMITSLGQKLMWVGGIAGSFAAGSIIKSIAEYEKFSNMFTTLYGGKKAGKNAMSWALGFDRQTPFELPEIIQSMARLKAYGVEASQGALKTIGDFSFSMGKRIQDGVEATVDAMMGEWERMKEFALKRQTLEAWITKKNMTNPFDKQGQVINPQAFNTALFGYMNERAAGAMIRMSDTLETKWSNFTGAIWRGGAALRDAISPQLQKILTVATKIVDDVFSEANIAKAGKWIESAFSEANVRKVATFFANLWVWAKALPERLSEGFKAVMDFMPKLVMGVVDFSFNMSNALIAITRFGRGLENSLIAVWNLMKKIRNPFAEMTPFKKLPQMMDAGDYLDWQNKVYNTFKGVQNGIGGMFSEPNSQEAANLVDKWIKAYNDSLSKFSGDMKSPIEKVAQNTATLVQQNNRMIGDFSNMGPSQQRLARRVAFSPATATASAGGGRIQVDVTGKTDIGEIIADALTQFSNQIGLNTSIDYVRRR